VLTADCAPVLFHDRAGVIGAAHAGWRGAIGGVTDRTVEAMEALGAQRAAIAAVVGPCIAQKSYEVDAGFERRFLEAAPKTNASSARAAGHSWFDLAGYVAHASRPRRGRGGHAGRGHLCPGRPFFSFRRATHKGEPGYGREISLIGLREG
jgi:copper oxidase (laccase) domain-containing protein